MNRKLSRFFLVVPFLLSGPDIAGLAHAQQAAEIEIGDAASAPAATPARESLPDPRADAPTAEPMTPDAAGAPAAAQAPQPRQRDLSVGVRLGEAVRLIASDARRADRLLDELLEDDALLEDVITYYRGVAVLDSDRARARRRFTQVIDDPDSVAAPKAAARLAELLLADHDVVALAVLAERFAGGTDDPNDSTAVALAAARALRAEDPAKSAELLMSVRRQSPGTRAGDEARAILGELRAAHPELAPTGAEQLYEEALLAGREADIDRQAELLDRLLAEHPEHDRHEDAVLLRAKVVAKRKGRASAASWLDQRIAAGTAPARLEAKMTYASGSHSWNAHESTQALAKFQRVVEMGTGISEEQQAWYAMGRIHESQRRYNAAASAYRKAARGLDGDLMRESKWRAGWSSYLAGNYEGAAWVFGTVADSSTRLRGVATGREAALYWEARSLERAGRVPEATGVYRTLLQEIPDGFYAYLAESRTGMRAKPPTVAWLQPTETPLPPQTNRSLQRAWQLEAGALHGMALAELRRAAATASPAVRRTILPELMEIGAFDLALRTSLALYRRGVLEENELYPFLYPHAFSQIVFSTATDMGIDPFLVYSLIRQESLFDPWAVSPANAYGLMQLLLPTAQRVGPSAGIESVELDDLFEPKVNIRLGTAYLRALRRRFDGNEVLVLASYNAGERAADRWRERLAGLEEDEFIEQISYRETRDYVKKILRNYRNYRRLYGEAYSAAAQPGAEGASGTGAEGAEKPSR